MADKRLVECQDCGYRWESSADNPRCAKADCGRSRNVEPVEQADDDADDADDEQDDQDDLADEPEPEPEPDDDTDEQDSDDAGGYTPRFDSTTNHVDQPDTPEPEAPITDEPDESDDDSQPDQADADDDAEELPELDPEDMEPMMAVSFDLIATRRGDHWALDDDEAERLAKAWTPVANAYAPALLKGNAAIAFAAVSTVAVLKPRIEEDRRQADLEEAEQRDDASTVEQADEPEPTTEPDDEMTQKLEAL